MLLSAPTAFWLCKGLAGCSSYLLPGLLEPQRGHSLSQCPSHWAPRPPWSLACLCVPFCRVFMGSEIGLYQLPIRLGAPQGQGQVPSCLRIPSSSPDGCHPWDCSMERGNRTPTWDSPSLYLASGVFVSRAGKCSDDRPTRECREESREKERRTALILGWAWLPYPAMQSMVLD